MDKNSLRKWAKEQRTVLDMQKISSVLVQKIQTTEEYKNSQNIMFFYPLKNEVNLLELLKDKSKKFFLPKIDGENLLCCSYKDGDKTFLSCFKTTEPLSKPCPKEQIELIIIPALACDKNGYRLGYGGGFYDRFLKDYKGIKISCVPQKLVLDSVYPEEHDIKMDIILTD